MLQIIFRHTINKLTKYSNSSSYFHLLLTNVQDQVLNYTFIDKLRVIFVRSINYNIVRACQEDNEKIILLLKDVFLKEDPLCQKLNIPSEDNNVNNIFECKWRNILKDGLTLKAINDENHIIGVCVNTINFPWESYDLLKLANHTKNEPTKSLFEIWAMIAHEPKLHKKFNIMKIFEFSYLSVEKNYQGFGIANRLIEFAIKSAREQGYNYARMDCTSEFSTKIARKTKMKLIWEIPYKCLINTLRHPHIIPNNNDDHPHPHPHTHIRVFIINLKEQQQQKINK